MNYQLQIKHNKELMNTIKKLHESVLPSIEQQKVMMEAVMPSIEKQKAIAETVRPLIEQNKAMYEAVNPNLEIIKSLKESILPSLKMIETWQKQFIPIFDRSQIEDLIRWKERKDSKEYQAFIKEWGWFFRKRTYSFGDYCFGLFKKFGNDELKNQLNQWFTISENIKPVIMDIKTKFPLRYPVVQEGLNYHQNGRYSVSITLLLPHTEGILWELGQKEKYVRRGYNSKKKYAKYIVNRSYDNWELSELSKQLFPDDKFHNILVNEIFCKGPRNKVLHGRNIFNNKQREITKWFSTLLILTLWRLSDEF